MRFIDVICFAFACLFEIGGAGVPILWLLTSKQLSDGAEKDFNNWQWQLGTQDSFWKVAHLSFRP